MLKLFIFACIFFMMLLAFSPFSKSRLILTSPGRALTSIPLYALAILIGVYQVAMADTATAPVTIETAPLLNGILQILQVLIAPALGFVGYILDKRFKSAAAQSLIASVTTGAGALGANVLAGIHISTAPLALKNAAIAKSALYFKSAAGTTLAALGYDPTTADGQAHIEAMAEKAITTYQDSSGTASGTAIAGSTATTLLGTAAPAVETVVDALLQHVPDTAKAAAVVSAIQAGATVSTEAANALNALLPSSTSAPAAAAT